MNKLIIFFTALVFTACGTATSNEQKESSEEHDGSSTALQLNNGSKWKADSFTHANVALLLQLANDSTYSDKKNQQAFSNRLQNGLDSLVQQCKMTGPGHEALHKWLQPVLHDAKELKEGEDEYNKVYGQLKKDVRQFYDYFE